MYVNVKYIMNLESNWETNLNLNSNVDFSILKFVSFQTIAFASLSNMWTTWSTRIVMVDYASTNQVSNKICLSFFSAHGETDFFKIQYLWKMFVENESWKKKKKATKPDYREQW